jgi:sphingolipid 4-desaturase/C4-monooxygenase
MQRNAIILAKYPQIKDLYGPDVRLFFAMVGIMIAQLTLSYAASHIKEWAPFVFLAWSLGGLLTHWLSLGNHELGHNLAFETQIFNEATGIAANLCQSIPSMIAFKKYHAPHHYHLNETAKDPDCPSRWEAEVFNTPVKKAIWMMCNPLLYAIRPLVMMPKPASAKEVFNIVFVLSFDLWLALQGPTGQSMLLFNFMSTLLGMGIHPMAGHFISEHYNLYDDNDGQETYSYYGPLNYFAFNVGYHNEHHDFPRISGFNLPKVTAIAPEFYLHLNPHYSWTKIVYDYIMEPNCGPFKRIVRRERPRSQ